MGINEIFYSVAILFFLVMIGYFISEYMENLASQVKAGLSFLLTIILFLAANLLRRRNI